MNIEDLYKKYVELHYSKNLDENGEYDGYCKSSCRVMEATKRFEPRFDENDSVDVTYYIECGTYCIGPGRWEIIGEGKTVGLAVDAAARKLDEWGKK